MLFPDLATETIMKSVRDLREDNKAAQRTMIDKLIDYYDNAQLEYLEGYGFKTTGTGAVTFQDAFEAWDEQSKTKMPVTFGKQSGWIIPPSWCNITKQVIDRVSMAYKFPPDRSLKKETREDQEVEEVDEYNEWIERYPRFNLTMFDVEVYNNLLHKVLFRPVFNTEKKKWKFFIECDYEAHFLEEDPLHPVAYSIPLKTDVEGEGVRDQKWLFWSDDLYFTYDNNGKIYDDEFGGVNPFKIIPMVEFRKRLPVNYYAPSGAIDLVQCNESINVNLMNLGMMLHFQAFDQAWESSGADKNDWKGIRVGANQFIHLPEGATMGLLGYNPKIIESVEAIRAQIQMISQTYGIKMNWSIDGTPASGFSLLVQNIELMENRERDVEMYKVYEQEIYDVLSTMQKYYGKAIDGKEPKLPIGAEVIVDFQELNFPVNQSEEQAKWDWEIDHNIATPIDYIQSKEGLSEDEARERYELNKSVNKKYSIGDIIKQRVEEEGGVVLPGGNLPNENV